MACCLASSTRERPRPHTRDSKIIHGIVQRPRTFCQETISGNVGEARSKSSAAVFPGKEQLTSTREFKTAQSLSSQPLFVFFLTTKQFSSLILENRSSVALAEGYIHDLFASWREA